MGNPRARSAEAAESSEAGVSVLAWRSPSPHDGSMRRHHLLALGGAFTVLAAFALFLLFSDALSSSGAPAVVGDAPSEPQSYEVENPILGTDPRPIPDYVPDPSGLPPVDAPASVAVPALEAAAANGNPTAACRLAVIQRDCFASSFARNLFSHTPPKQAEEELARLIAQTARREPSGHLPESLDAFLSAHEANSLERFSSWAPLSESECAVLPQLSVPDVLDGLHRAALTGDPSSMARYVQGEPFVVVLGVSAATLAGQAGPGFSWITHPSFDTWRKEAERIRDLGLARADIPMLIAVAEGPAFAFSGVIPADPRQSAAATRALAGILGDYSPPSTITLGLPPAQAESADRLADTWIAAYRARHAHRSVDVRRNEHLRAVQRGASTCE